MASWARQRQQITEAADGGARARTGADGAVVLNLRRGPGAYALLSRADGQLTRAGQHYYSHLGLQPPSKDFDYNQPLIREGPNDYILLRNGQKKLVRSLQGGEHRLTKLGKGFFRDKYYEYLVHVPVIIRGRRRSGRNAGAGYERRDWLPVNELGGATRHPAHLTEEQVAQRVRQQVEASLDPGGPILQLSDETYFLDPEGHWVVSTQSTRYRNSRTEVETLLRQRMRGLRSVSFQLPCEEDVLQSAFEDKPLCVPRQLAELLQLSVEEVCADFDAMLRHDWRRLGISAEEVREFCVWRNAPMRVLSSQGDLVDSYDPALKEHRTVCFLAFDGHCYMYRAVKRVLERAARVLYRGEARQTLPPIQEWRRFDAADVQPGLFWCEDLREARRQLMAAGESPKVAISSPAQYCGLRLRRGTRIRELPEEHEVLRRWCEALNQEYRGQRLAGLAHEIFLKLLKAKREVPGAAERQQTLAAQGGKCALCGCGLTAGTCELDHVVPVRQAFAGSVQTLQALCGDCHSEKTLRESAQPTSLESRVAPGVMEYVRSPKLPPLVFEAQTCAKDSTYVGVDVVRCRRNGLANAPFPLPILCPADGVEPVDGVLPDLGFVEGCCDARQSCLNLLPYVGPGWYPKVSLAAMLDLGVCRWDHIVLGISARSHVDAATLRRALERMDAAWQGEEHMAKLSVNAMIGLWARSTEVVYSVRSSSSELDGAGADFSQAFAYEGGMVWDFVYARRLLSNGTYRPIHDAVLGFEHCMVAKARRILDAPPRYLAQVKTDCLLTQRLPKRFAERLRALEALRHPDGTPVYRVEETKPLLGSSRAPRMEAERPKQRRWNGVDDPVNHCLAGNSLLLTGLPGTGKTHLPRTIVARLREQGEAVHLVSKTTHCSAQNLGLGAQTADHWVRRYVRGGSAQKLDWLVVEEITQLDMALWADLACVGLNADVKFLLLGDFRQLPAVLDSWAGRPISAPLEHSQLIRDLAGGHRHELTENMRSDPGIFDFVKWLRVGEEACPTLEQAKARLRELFPSKPGWPDTTLVISHSKRMAVNAAANRALAPEGSKLLELDVIHMGCCQTTNEYCQTATPQNSPQSMRVWPGLRLIGAGGKIPKGVFVAVAEVEPDGVRLDNGMRLKNQELLRATRPSHAVTYASCQGLTLHNRVRLDLDLYVGASRATSSELLEA